MSNKSPLVVFDLGGVIVRICQTWQEAVEVAGLDSPILSAPKIPLTDFAPFNAYQATELSQEDYLEALADFVGVTTEQALNVHLGILRELYPGIGSVIADIKAAGIATGCLSNTNPPHWHSMTETEPFDVVATLDFRAGSHELGCAKPDPNAFKAYAALFGLEDFHVVYFDDSEANVKVAKDLGWEAYVVDPWGDPPAQLSALLRRIPGLIDSD